MLQLGEEPFDQVSFAVEPLAEAGLPFAVASGWDVRGGALLLDQLADTIGVVRFVRKHDGARTKMIKQTVGDLAVMSLPSGQGEPDREPLRIDDNVDLGREAAA